MDRGGAEGDAVEGEGGEDEGVRELEGLLWWGGEVGEWGWGGLEEEMFYWVVVYLFSNFICPSLYLCVLNQNKHYWAEMAHNKKVEVDNEFEVENEVEA